MPDDPRPPHWTWLLASLCALALACVRTTRARLRRAVHRARVVVGAGLIDAGDWMMPDPALREAPDGTRFAAHVQQERRQVRVNGRHEGPI